jgi:hypothetical protein
VKKFHAGVMNLPFEPQGSKPKNDHDSPARLKGVPSRKRKIRTSGLQTFVTGFGRRLLVFQELLNGGGEMFGLRKDYVFELGVIGAEGVHGGHALHWGIQLVEEFFGNAGGDF